MNMLSLINKNMRCNHWEIYFINMTRQILISMFHDFHFLFFYFSSSGTDWAKATSDEWNSSRFPANDGDWDPQVSRQNILPPTNRHAGINHWLVMTTRPMRGGWVGKHSGRIVSIVAFSIFSYSNFPLFQTSFFSYSKKQQASLNAW